MGTSGASSPAEPNGPRDSAVLTGSNQLALTSFLLSLAAPVLWPVHYLLADVVTALLPPTAQGLGVAVSVFLPYGGGLITSVSAFVAGIVALRRGKLYPPQQAWNGFAIAGLVIGIITAVALVCLGGIIVLFVVECANSATGC